MTAMMPPPPLVKQFTSAHWDPADDWPRPFVGAIVIAVATKYPHTPNGSKPISITTFDVLKALCNGLKFKKEGSTKECEITTKYVEAKVIQITKSKAYTLKYIEDIMKSCTTEQAIAVFNTLVYPSQQFSLTEEGQVVCRDNQEVKDLRYDQDLGNHYWGLVVSAINEQNPCAAEFPAEWG